MFKRFDDTDPRFDRQSADQPQQLTRPVLLCDRCHAEITTPEDRIEQRGGHIHVCTNPAGVTFRIGCFRQADGCTEVGASSAEHTWFPGYRWRIAVCGRCLTHLGWLYVSEVNDHFAGLILDHLIEESRTLQ